MPQPEKESKQQIKELIELNDELENYFRYTIIPQIFVDAHLILRKFTPPAMEQFRKGDTGKAEWEKGGYGEWEKNLVSSSLSPLFVSPKTATGACLLWDKRRR